MFDAEVLLFNTLILYLYIQYIDLYIDLHVQIIEAMEIMLLAVVSPEIRCEWRLDDWQVALVSTVSPNLLIHLLIFFN